MSDLPEYMKGSVVIIDGEPYVRLRHVHALFEHTEEGMRFARVRHKLISWRKGAGLMFFDVVGEDRPQHLLEREFGKLPL